MTKILAFGFLILFCQNRVICHRIAQNKWNSLFLPKSYGFIDRCIDGVYLTIDSISITLKSKTFNANLDVCILILTSLAVYVRKSSTFKTILMVFKLSNINVYSTTPKWTTTQDIRLTCIKDTERGEILIFKVVSTFIQIVRFRAKKSNFFCTNRRLHGKHVGLLPIQLIQSQKKILARQ